MFLPIFFIFKDIYTIMVGCGIENVNLLVSALKRHTRHVQVIVFERDDMVSGPIVIFVDLLNSCAKFFIALFIFSEQKFQLECLTRNYDVIHTCIFLSR